MYDQLREETLYSMLYAVVTTIAMLASCYLLFGRANAIAPDVFLLQFDDLSVAGEGHHVGELLVADNNPDAILVLGNVLLMELHDILRRDSRQQAGHIGVGVGSIAVPQLVSHIFGNAAEGGIVVLDAAEELLTC